MEGKIKKKKRQNKEKKSHSKKVFVLNLFFSSSLSGAPAGLKYSEVRDGLLAVKGVTAVHNLHIWALTMNQAVLTAHVAIGEKELETVILHLGVCVFLYMLSIKILILAK